MAGAPLTQNERVPLAPIAVMHGAGHKTCPTVFSRRTRNFMSNYTQAGGLQVDSGLKTLIDEKICPGTGVTLRAIADT